MAREPADRYLSAEAMGIDLTDWLSRQSGPVSAQDIERFVKGLFGRRAEEMRQAIDEAHRVARNLREQGADRPRGTPLIPRETLDEIAGLVPDPVQTRGVASNRRHGSWGWLWLVFFAAGIGFIWFFGRR